MELDQIKKDLHQALLDAQAGKYDTYDKVRHEAGCPRGISVMRLADIFSASPQRAAYCAKELVREGLVVVHNEGCLDMSFEAVEKP